VTAVDLLVLAWIVLSAVLGAQRGLVAHLLSLGGFALGAVIGSRVAPHLTSSTTTWAPLAALGGALVGGLLLQGAAGALGAALRPRTLLPPLRALDAAGGLLIGAALGLASAWLVAVVALQVPSLGVRGDVRRSTLLPALMRALPPERVLAAIARYDPLPVLPALPQGLPVPERGLLRRPAIDTAAQSVVKVQGTACGLGVEGSGWVARPDLVATNAHVVAGETDTSVVEPSGDSHSATVVYMDTGNDVALLRVPGLGLHPLRLAGDLDRPRSVALVGYPGNGPLVAVPGTAGPPTTVLAPDALGGSRRPRLVVPLRGRLRHGDSGGPAVDGRGRAVATMFAAGRSGGGFGVPSSIVASALARPHAPVSTGAACAS
jgi:S1-C subfamily serine protease